MRPARRGGAASLAAFALAAFALAACPLGAAADETSPFRTRNLSPLVSVFGIPAWSMRGPGTRAGVQVELANHYRFSRRGSETLILDGETSRRALWLEHGFDNGWSVSLELPYYRQSGGVLDDLIDAWHSAFGMPDGGRNRRPEGEIAYLLENESGAFLSITESGGAFGDALIGVARRVGRDGAARIEATVKLPTGDDEWLAGSGAADFALTYLASRTTAVWQRSAGYYWGAGAMLLGTPDTIEYDARRAGLLGVVGGSIRVWPRTGFKAQMELHSPLYASRLKEIGDPGVQVTVGGWRDIGERGVVEFAVNEDLAVSTSPDVVMHLSFYWSFR